MFEHQPERHVTGGLRLAAHKAASTASPIRRDFVPRELVIAMRQHRGSHAEPVVTVGQHVRRGELIGRGGPPPSAAVHAPLGGRVRAIEERTVPGSRMLRQSLCAIIDVDSAAAAPLDAQRRLDWPAGRAKRLEQIAAAGIVGLGGAAFPTAEKLAAPVPCQALIVNGAECEPHISCDDMLMRERPEEILFGVTTMLELLGTDVAVIAIERDKPEALRAVRNALKISGEQRVRIAEIPTVYPSGGERQLVELLFDVEVPSGRFPSEIGYPCQNVGTAYALARLVRHGEPLLSRVVTVTGEGIASPQNVEVPIGTPVAELIAFCGGYRENVSRLLLGGSMMGYALPTDDVAVTKACNCFVAAAVHEVRQAFAEWPCIRCGECARACPARLQPQELLVMTRSHDQDALTALGLEDCIECGCCDVICPSQIPLTEYFRRAKREHALYLRQLELSAQAERRHASHAERAEAREREAQSRRQELIARIRGSQEAERRAVREAVARAEDRRRQSRGE
jgi:electron transport complex protein RnfC